TTARLRIDERVLHFMAGVGYLDARLHGLLTRVPAPVDDLPPAHLRAVDAVATAWSRTHLDGAPHVELVGADRRSRWDVAAPAAPSAPPRRTTGPPSPANAPASPGSGSARRSCCPPP